MSTQQITPELRKWIIVQAQSGQTPDSVLKSMRASGWREDVAITALEDTLQGFLAQHAKSAGLPEPVLVPEPDMSESRSVVSGGDRDVQIVFSMRSPRVIVFGGLLSDDECDELIELSRPRLARSQTVEIKTGSNEVNAARTSQGMFFECGEKPLIARIEQRIATLVNWPLEKGEGLQILHYQPGAEYKPHYDYFEPSQPGTPSILKRGGQRVGTLVMYLNTPLKGGGTTFPDVGVEVSALKGNGVFFSYDRAHPITRTLHGGAPVIEGEKWVATKWLRQETYV